MLFLFVFYKQVIPLLISVRKLFSFRSKTIHALLASKRCLIGLQKVPFKTLSNALLKPNQASFLESLCNCLILFELQSCFLYALFTIIYRGFTRKDVMIFQNRMRWVFEVLTPIGYQSTKCIVLLIMVLFPKIFYFNGVTSALP